MNGFVVKDGRELKCGYTTGSCATAAAKAGAEMLLGDETIHEVAIDTPKGITLTLQVENVIKNNDWVSCTITKDAGDDPDVTNGIKISASIELTGEGIIIDGGKGVGRVTRPGLSLKTGEAAINPVPRKMITDALLQTARKYNYEGGFSVIVSAERGEEIARKTFNPRLGIEGGISILGTSGIVEPMSEKAIIDTIHLEINSRAVENSNYLLISPGNYGRDFSLNTFGLDMEKGIKCSNYIGETIDYAVYKTIKNILLIGHAGKLSKIAGGIMNTHSRMADCRCEIFAAHAALAGASGELTKSIMLAITTGQIDEILRESGLAGQVYGSIMSKLHYHLNQRSGSNTRVETIMFTDRKAAFYETDGAAGFIEEFKKTYGTTNNL